MDWSTCDSLPEPGAEVFVVTKQGGTAIATLSESRTVWTIYQHPVRWTASLDGVSLWSPLHKGTGSSFSIPADTLLEILSVAINAARAVDVQNPSLLRIMEMLHAAVGAERRSVRVIQPGESPLAPCLSEKVASNFHNSPSGQIPAHGEMTDKAHYSLAEKKGTDE